MKKILIVFLCNLFCLSVFADKVNRGLDSGLVIDNVSATDASCIADDATATVMTSGGTQPLTYTWENNADAGTVVAMTNPATGLAGGMYTITVSDAVGCFAVDSVLVGLPPSPIVLGIGATDATCGNEDGAIAVFIEDSLQPFTYNWENAMNPGVTISTSDMPTNLATGVYNVTITGVNSCTVTASQAVGSEDGPEILDIPVSDSFCGEANGGAIVSLSGGTMPYTYNWENENVLGVPVSTTEVASNLAEGLYNLTVTDANGCTVFGIATVGGTQALTFDLSSTNPTCFGANDGTAGVLAMGGTFYYTYLWSNGSTNEVALNLPGGIHTVTVTDTDGCAGTAEVELSGPGEVFFSTTSTNSTCSGLNNGTVTILDVSGGDGAPYLYSIDNLTYSPDSIFTNLGEGLYDIYVQDANGCVALENSIVESTTVLELTYGEDVEIDFGESIDLFPTANFSLDTALYTWTWAQDTSLIFNNLPYNPIAQPNTTTTYSVTVTDANACSVSDEITIRVNVERDVFIPNVFSPNFDGSNDVFTIFGGIGVARVNTFQIFDRWGAKVHEASDFPPNSSEFGWDGRQRGSPVAQGVYVYYIEVDFVDGSSDSYRGDVTVLR